MKCPRIVLWELTIKRGSPYFSLGPDNRGADSYHLSRRRRGLWPLASGPLLCLLLLIVFSSLTTVFYSFPPLVSSFRSLGHQICNLLGVSPLLHHAVSSAISAVSTTSSARSQYSIPLCMWSSTVFQGFGTDIVLPEKDEPLTNLSHQIQLDKRKC
ncbi:hypothetical protein HID58_053422 [Brassica napus]|uniref:Uncharacterized protein n=1 Tax=Brassica napus TaxID=3708 RepID=A0ABQ8AFK1_BRANA|nr:hypothetical protein HID58_053422 [Brassica napus]